jgi:hypothetical protein
VQTGKGSAAGHKLVAAAELTICDRCLAVYSRRTWRKRAALSATQLARALWRTCPACKQMSEDEYFGRVLIRGLFARQNEDAIRRRIENIDARARFTQPERQVIAIDAAEGTGRRRPAVPDVLEVRTTSQKLAHRIVRELKKAFRGRAVYRWSDDDGTLQAVWQRDQ